MLLLRDAYCRGGALSLVLKIHSLSGHSVNLPAVRRRSATVSIAVLSYAPGRRYQSREEAFDPCEHAMHTEAAIGPVAKEIQQFAPELHACLTRSGDA